MRMPLTAVVALCAPLLFSAGLAHAAGQAKTMNYDCSKAGNANKAACKGAAAAAPKPKAVPAPTAAAMPAKTMNYDCSKAGNANKAACKGQVPAPAAQAPVRPTPVSVTKPAPAPAAAQTGNARIVPWTTKTGKVVHYDCSKAGNATKQACKQ